MRTPGILIFGMVMAPCGWVLDLTSTVATNWRTVNNVPGYSTDMVVGQGIWDSCLTYTSSRTQTCNQQGSDQIYFTNKIIPIAQGMMVASLIVTALGLVVATPGVRCWREKPRWILAALGGLLIFCSGVLAIIPIAWYTHIMTSINSTMVIRSSTTTPDIRVGYCIILGYIGGIMEVLGGFVMFIGICSCCGGRNRGEKPEPKTRERPVTRPTAQPRSYRPRNVSPSNSSSVPYSQKSLDDDLDFPRAKTRDRDRGRGTDRGRDLGSVNASYTGRPYDADL